MKNEQAKQSKLWVESHRWLLYFFATKNPLTALFFVVPLVLFWLFRMDFNSISKLNTFFLILAGFIQWSLLEYLLHRFLFHWRPKNIIVRNAVESIHIYHHRNIKDQEVITSGPVFAIFWSCINFSILNLLTLSLNQSAHIMFGLTIAYYAYEWIHYLVHHKNFNSGPMKYLQDYHLLHHERWHGNYGQTSPLWDMLLGTSLSVKEIQSEKKKKYIFPYQKNLNI